MVSVVAERRPTTTSILSIPSEIICCHGAFSFFFLCLAFLLRSSLQARAIQQRPCPRAQRSATEARDERRFACVELGSEDELGTVLQGLHQLLTEELLHLALLQRLVLPLPSLVNIFLKSILCSEQFEKVMFKISYSLFTCFKNLFMVKKKCIFLNKDYFLSNSKRYISILNKNPLMKN